MAGATSRSRLIVVLGGASSGKSDVALKLALKGVRKGRPHAFVATGEALDEEMAAKIARHRLSRSSAWITAEVPVDLEAWFNAHAKKYGAVVVDCLTMWLSNQCEKHRREKEVLQETQALLRAIRSIKGRVVLVTNELGMGLVPVDAPARRFRELAGSVNRLVADEADEVHLVVSGIPLRLK